MHTEEIAVIIGLLGVMILLVGLAGRIGVPYPILLVIGGLGISLVPGLPAPELAPEIVFLIFLPPLLMYAAYFTSIRDFKRNAMPIALLSVGLVLFTTLAVAAVAHAAIPSLTWPLAFVLGAIASPPDAVAATSIAQRLNLPRRVVTVLEGESLVNDATALVALGVALDAVGGEAFSAPGAALRFAEAGAGGVAIGLAIAWLVVRIWRFVEDPAISITVSFLATYGAYLASEELHVSGVLAVVALGLYLGRNGDGNSSPRTRLEGVSIWTIVVFVLNGLVFILIGLQLRQVLEGGIGGASPATLARYAVVVSAAVILSRLAWVYPATYGWRLVWRLFDSSILSRDPQPNWRVPTIVGWTGMRGVVSLAAALALPEAIPEQQRSLILFLTFCVILATLVLQGLTLPALIRVLSVADDGSAEREETKARWAAAKAGLERLEQLAEEDWVAREMAEDLALHYEARTRRFSSRYLEDGDGTHEEHAVAYERLQRELLEAERQAVVRLRNDGVINDEALRRVQREIDLERVRIGGE